LNGLKSQKWEERKMNDVEAAIQEKIKAFHSMTASEEFKRYERMRFDAECIQASKLYNARNEEREKWQGVIAEKDARIAQLEAQIAKMRTNNE
jgi:hypothetical protein